MKTELPAFVQTVLKPGFTSFWPLALFALFALIATVIWLRKNERRKSIRILHLLSVVLLFWMLFQWNLVRTSIGPREITVLLDDSPSMTLTDALDSASEIAVKLEKELTSKERDVKIARLSELSSDPEKTPLGDGLTKILRQSGSKPDRMPNSRRVILLSDGLSNVGSPVEDSISEARNRNVNIFTVPIGPSEPLPQIRIARVVSPRTVLLGDEVRMKVEVNANLSNFVLSVFDKNSIVFQKSYVGEKDPSTPLEISWTPETSGEKTVSIRVETNSQVHSDKRLTSHAVPLHFTVLDRRRHVLLVTSKPSWEYRYLRNLLKRSERFDLDALFLGKSNPTDANDPALLSTPPDSAALSSYDIVILCSPDASPESAGFFEDVANSELGTNSTKLQLLVILAGRHFEPGAWIAGSFRDLFPFHQVESGLTSIPHKEVFRLETTPIGREWQFLPDTATPENFETCSAISIAHPSPDAQILAQFSQSDKTFPAILFQPRGRGGVLFLAMDDTWRLRRGNIETYNNFWASLLTHAATFSNDASVDNAPDNPKPIENQDLQTLIPDYPLEWERTWRDDFVLRTIATQTDGRSFSPDKIDDLIREIRIREQYDDPRIGRFETSYPLWNLLPVWILFGILVLVRLVILRRYPQEG